MDSGTRMSKLLYQTLLPVTLQLARWSPSLYRAKSSGQKVTSNKGPSVMLSSIHQSLLDCETYLLMFKIVNMEILT